MGVRVPPLDYLYNHLALGFPPRVQGGCPVPEMVSSSIQEVGQGEVARGALSLSASALQMLPFTLCVPGEK